MQTPIPAQTKAGRRTAFGVAAFAAVLVATYVFFAFMAHFEPINGDGWIVTDALARKNPGFWRILGILRAYHFSGNPRFGQLFTFLTYRYQGFHDLVTPLMLTGYAVLAVVHATGRSPLNVRGAGLLLFTFAAAWLATPALSDAFFYRPITTNYVYSVTLFLAYFLPMRFDVRVARWGSAILLGLTLFVFGLVIGKLNEHTGPALVAVAALSTALALRERRYRDALWRGLSTAGVLGGFLLLFFAPGQLVRYGKLGRQSVFDTISQRGLEGNLDLIMLFAHYVAPLLCAVALLLAIHAAFGPHEEERTSGRGWPLVYLLVAAVMVGLSLAAPKNNYRLCIAPALLVVIAAVAAMDRMWQSPTARWLAMAGALVVHLGFVALCWQTYSAVYPVEVKRTERAKAAARGSELVVPRLPYHRGNRVFMGDGLNGDQRSRKRMAKIYGVKSVTVVKE